MDRSYIGGGEWIKGNKKFLYHFEILVVLFKLEKEMSKLYAVKPRRANS